MINYVVELLITILAVFLSWCVMTFRLCLSMCLIRSPFLSQLSIPHSHSHLTHPFRFFLNSIFHSTFIRSTHTTNACSSPSRVLIYMKFSIRYARTCAQRCYFAIVHKDSRSQNVFLFSSCDRDKLCTRANAAQVMLFVHSL